MLRAKEHVSETRPVQLVHVSAVVPDTSMPAWTAGVLVVPWRRSPAGTHAGELPFKPVREAGLQTETTSGIHA
jgi:hypothetical protein